MDKHNRYTTKEQDAARSIVLERQERISIEERSRMLIKNTHTQVQELYRREKHKRTVEHDLIPVQKSSSLSDGKILQTRLKVDSLDKQIKHEIHCMKRYRDFFLHSEGNSSGGRQRQTPQTNRTWGQSLASNNSSANINDNGPQDTNRTLALSNPISAQTEESRPRFRTLGVKPTSKQEKELLDMIEAEAETEQTSQESSQERISGGCTFGHDIPGQCSTYQFDYSQSAMSRQCPTVCSQPPQMMMPHPGYHGPHSCICCEIQPLGSSSPMSQATNQTFSYAASPSYQHQPAQCYPPNSVDGHPYGCRCSCAPQPNFARRVSDLNTEDFCQYWCRNPRDSRSPSNARSLKSSQKESTKASSARSRTSSRSPSAKEKFDQQVKKKLHEAGISDSTSLAQYKVEDHKKIVKVTLRKQDQANYKKPTKAANDQMIIKDYVPVKTPKRKYEVDDKAHLYKEYVNLYEKENQKNLGAKTVEKEVKKEKETPKVQSHPTYTKIQDSKPSGYKSQQSNRSSKTKPPKVDVQQRRPGDTAREQTNLSKNQQQRDSKVAAASKEQAKAKHSDRSRKSREDTLQSSREPGPSSKRDSYDSSRSQQVRQKNERQQQERENKERQEQERQEQERQQQEREERERQQQERQEQERQQQEREERERQQQERQEQERQQQEREKRERQQQERQELERQQQEREKIERQQQELEKIERQQQEREEQERQQQEREEQERQQQEREKRERQQQERKEQERQQQERQQQEHQEQERQEKVRQQQEREKREGQQQERQQHARQQAKDKDYDSGLGRNSDSGNQQRFSFDNSEYKTEPSDERWGNKQGHRLSLDPSRSNRMPEERGDLAPGEIESTTSICRTYSQHFVSIKRSDKEGGPLIRRETKRYNKECVSYVTKDIDHESELPQTSTKQQELSSPNHGNQRKHQIPPQTPDLYESADTLYPSKDSGQFAKPPRKQEERLTQTEIFMQEERPTQTELEASREERRTQTEPDIRHERLTQTDLLPSQDRQERLTQTGWSKGEQMTQIPSQMSHYNLLKDGNPAPVKEYLKSETTAADRWKEPSNMREGNRNQQSSPPQSDQNGKSPSYETSEDDQQPTNGYQAKDQNYQQGKEEVGSNSEQDRRTSTAPSSSYYSFEAPATQKEQIPTAWSNKQNYSNFGSPHMDYDIHQVPTQHDLQSKPSTPKELSDLSERFDRSVEDPEEIMCKQYRQSIECDPEEILYRQQQMPRQREEIRRHPGHQPHTAAIDRNRRGQQSDYAYQTGQSGEEPSPSETPQAQACVNTYEWRTGTTYEKHSSPEKLHERCATYSKGVRRSNCKSRENSEGTGSSEYSVPCSGYMVSNYNGQQMPATRQHIGRSVQNQANSSAYGEWPIYYYQGQNVEQHLPQTNNPQENRTQYYTQYSPQPNQIADNRRILTQQVQRQPVYNRPQHMAESRRDDDNTFIDKRTRTVKFDDENGGGRIKRDTAETMRSVIDWEKAYRQGLLSDQIRSGYLTESETDIMNMNTCRSSSSANTEVTCVESNHEEEYVTCEEDTIPPFSGCPCMFETYLNLANLYRNRSYPFP